MLKEFKEFAMRGNVLDMAVGIIVGAAFGQIVNSFVQDVMMPPIGRLVGHVDFSNLFVNLTETHYPTIAAAKAAGAATLNYGLFLNTVINFLIVAFAVFLQCGHFVALAATRDCPYCLSAVPAKATKCSHCTSELRPV